MKFLLLLITFFSVSTVFSQPKGMGKSDPAAKAILDAISKKIKTYKTITSDITLKVENASGKLVSQKQGAVQLKGPKFKIKMNNQEFYCNGSLVTIYDKNDNTATINKFDGNSKGLTPQKIFTDFYNKDFLYKLNPDQKLNGKAVSEIELTPIDKSKPFFKVMVWVDKATSTIVSTKIFENSGNRTTYNMTNLKPNLPMADVLFNFDKAKFPGVEIEDAR